MNAVLPSGWHCKRDCATYCLAEISKNNICWSPVVAAHTGATGGIVASVTSQPGEHPKTTDAVQTP